GGVDADDAGIVHAQPLQTAGDRVTGVPQLGEGDGSARVDEGLAIGVLPEGPVEGIDGKHGGDSSGCDDSSGATGVRLSRGGAASVRQVAGLQIDLRQEVVD